jgi:undecaprenyl-diphosphatase
MPFSALITNFGDSSITIPLSALTLGFLLRVGASRAALAWTIAIGGCGLTIAVMKIALHACGGADLNPSGHAAMSAAVYGCIAVILATQLDEWWRWLMLSLAALMAAGIGLSRIAVGAHHPPDVAIGLLVGSAAVALFQFRLGSGRVALLAPGELAVAAAAVVAMMYGIRWPVEEVLIALAAMVRPAMAVCY